MRLYKKIKSLETGIAASKNNKGILLFNPTGTSPAEYTVDIINVDKTITTLDLTLNQVGANALSLATNPNYALIPFRISSWTDTDAIGLKAYELF